MANVEVRVSVAASGDDVRIRASGTLETASSNLFAGKEVSTSVGSALRFQLNIPQGATIVSAVLEAPHTATNSTTTVCRTRIRLEAADTAAAITTAAQFNARTRTTAQTAWEIPSWAGVTDGDIVTFPDFAAAVQEVIDRAGWSANNYVNVFWDDNGSDTGARRNLFSFDAAYSKPTLVVVYDDTVQPIEADVTGSGDLTAAIGFAAGSYVEAVDADAPHLWYRLEETAGANVADFAGTNDGTASGTYDLDAAGTGKTGSAIDFTAGRIDSGNLALTGQHDLAVEAWLHLDTAPTPTVTPDSAFLLWHDPEGYLAFQVRDAAKTTWAVARTTMPATGAWHHVVGVWDRAAKRARLYLNGTLVDSSAEQAFEDIGALTQPLTAGVDQDGRTDEIALYATALSAARIEAHYLAGRYAQYLDADAVGSGDLTTTLRSALRLTAAADGAGDITGAITRTALLTAADAGAGDITGSLRAILRLTAAIIGSGDVAASIGVARYLAAAVDGSGDLTADVAGAAGLDAALVGAGDLSTTVLAVLRLAANADGAGDVTGSVHAARHLAAAADGAGDITSGITRVIYLAADAIGSGDVTAATVAVLRLTAAADGAGDITSGIGAARLLVAAATGDGDVASALTSALRLAADATGAGDLTAALTAVIALASATAGAGDVTASFDQLTSVTLAPASAIASANIVNELGTTANLHASVNEGMSSPDGDSTYLVNTQPDTGSVTFGLSGIPGTLDHMRTLNVRVRARREA